MGIFYGLLTALTWGSADLFARYATRKIGTLRTMLYMQLTGFILLTLAMHWLGGWGHLDGRFRLAAVGLGNSGGPAQCLGHAGALPFL